MIGLPGLALGAAPLLLSAWVSSLTGAVRTLAGLTPLLAASGLLALGWFVGRPALRIAEQSFWSLNAIAVQPGYALTREALRHIAERAVGPRRVAERRAALGAVTAAVGGVAASLLGFLVCFLAWDHTRWAAAPADLSSRRPSLCPHWPMPFSW